jgi:hypothetical protein
MLQSEKNQFLFLMTKVPNLGSSSSDQKKMCITKNRVGSPSNLGNGMFQMTFLGILDIYGVKNRLIRYLCMLKSPLFSMMTFPRF